MCEHCGCGQKTDFTVAGPAPEHVVHWHTHTDVTGNIFSHAHRPPQGHVHEHAEFRQETAQPQVHSIAVAEAIIGYNNKLAERNRGFLRAKKIKAVNIVSSPGAGKTTLIEATIQRLKGRHSCAVIVGDLATQRDAERFRKLGVQAVQITTGTVCHLDAQMVAAGLEQLQLDGLELLFIENVGNLVCPASYDLGEDCRVVLLPVTEGEDKPLKYPPIFHSSTLVLITKMDLAEPTSFDFATARANIAAVAPRAHVIELSAQTGIGMNKWVEFLEQLLQRHDGLLEPTPTKS